MRDDKWLFQILDEVWDKYFLDVPQDNDVRIVWGRKARTRLGSIKEESIVAEKGNKMHPATIITINSLFKDEAIPEYVVTATVAHELAHYAHGFSSPLEQKFDKPHAGGVIHQELARRGLGSLEKRQKKWLRENWREYIIKHFPPKRRRVVIRWI
ncbi:MAG: hypothetical protein PHW75_02225 [Patescibacteria group bacterium]|nr:hypothetical protein [Patescibacteria group bacterium]